MGEEVHPEEVLDSLASPDLSRTSSG